MKLQNVVKLLALVGLAVVCASCGPLRNPLPNTVKTAHGNTDWHKDTAQEFLDGKNLAGTPVASNFAPAGWTKTHMHTGLSNTADYYYDKSKVASGKDTDGTNGIDTSMMFFYAGHGNPDGWSTLGNSAGQGDMLLANQADGGLVRYYWQCSCEVFAHGARTCTDNSMEYGCPGTFDGSADSYDMRNAYGRWGPALTRDLRMACGSSTEAWCWNGETDAIWNNFNNNHYYVSDAFVYGLQTYHSEVMPVCLTIGGSDVTATPLWDLSFTNAYNNSGTSRYHMQYGYHFTSTSRYPKVIATIPKELAVLKLQPMPKPTSLTEMKFKQSGDWSQSTQETRGRGPSVQINNLSGAVYIIGDTGGFAEGKALSEEEYIRRAREFIQQQGWDEKTVNDPIGDGLRIQSVPVKGEGRDIQEVQKNVKVLFKRQVETGGQLVNVLGEGGLMDVQMNNDGSVLNAEKVWRQVAGEGEVLPVKPYEQALAEAMKQIEKPDNYKLSYWNWGYKELPGNVKQDEMRIVYQFDFIAVEPKLAVDFPPITIEIAGQ
jgi:hypothetical protein